MKDSGPPVKKYRRKKKRSLSQTGSLRKFARIRSETQGMESANKTKNFIKKLNKKRTKTDAKPPQLALDDMDSPRTQQQTHKYINSAINDLTNSGLTFDYGFRYYYWDYYKDNEDRDKAYNNSNKYKYWYIPCKQNNLKLEMINLFEYNPKQSVKKTKAKTSIFGSPTRAKLITKFSQTMSNNNNNKEQKHDKDKDKRPALSKDDNHVFNDDDSDHNDESKSDEKQNEDDDAIVCGMSMDQWNDIEERAHHIHRTWKCKKLLCESTMWKKQYQILEGDIIKKEHIIAVLIFCTFDRIRNEFLMTFNQYYHTALLVEDKMNDSKNGKSKNRNSVKHNGLFDYERGIELMKKNHSYFVNLAKLLRECVECFGSKLCNFMRTEDDIQRNENKKFYFGVNNGKGLFQRTLAQFKVPLLCSSSMKVVTNYMQCYSMDDHLSSQDNDIGLMVEVKYYDPFIRYFDASWITEFCAESEMIFSGGISMLKIEQIYNLNQNTTHKLFIRAMNILQSMLSGKMKKEPMSESEEQIIRYLVQNEFIRAMNNDTDITNNVNGKSIIPHYVSLLFHHFCINLKSISINLHRMNDDTFYGYFAIKSLFLTSQNNFIKLDVLCSLFPNVPIIKIIGHHSRKQNCIKLDELFFEEVLLILDSNLISRKCNLTKIMIGNANEDDMTLEQAIVQYQKQFEHKFCRMKIKVKTRELIIERPNNINEYQMNMNALGLNGMIHDSQNNAQNQGCIIQ